MKSFFMQRDIPQAAHTYHPSTTHPQGHLGSPRDGGAKKPHLEPSPQRTLNYPAGPKRWPETPKQKDVQDEGQNRAEALLRREGMSGDTENACQTDLCYSHRQNPHQLTAYKAVHENKI